MSWHIAVVIDSLCRDVNELLMAYREGVPLKIALLLQKKNCLTGGHVQAN